MTFYHHVIVIYKITEDPTLITSVDLFVKEHSSSHRIKIISWAGFWIKVDSLLENSRLAGCSICSILLQNYPPWDDSPGSILWNWETGETSVTF